ncbi:MAG: hypothetical protein C0392_15970 [Syntrophus sp. (in: bacteria)]|nr:hypothetical protein [Syntrophus sp. (in: bacteria)]
MWEWIIIGGAGYAAYKYFTKKSNGNESSAEPHGYDNTDNPLEMERKANIQQAKDIIYQTCFSQLKDLIPRAYKNNQYDTQIRVKVNTTSLKLDRDTIHKVLTKASYDALQNVGLKAREAPSFHQEGDLWTVFVKWPFR